ncbi:hypothetical protein ACWGOE_07360 [Leucobacter chromiiresistens]
MTTMSNTTDQPLDHFEIIDTARTAAARALANLRAAMCGFTESKQHYYEGLLFPLEVGFGLSDGALENRIRQAAALEAASVSDDVLQVFLQIAATGRVGNEDLVQLQERLGTRREQWAVLCTRDHRGCMRTAQIGDPR